MLAALVTTLALAATPVPPVGTAYPPNAFMTSAQARLAVANAFTPIFKALDVDGAEMHTNRLSPDMFMVRVRINTEEGSITWRARVWHNVYQDSSGGSDTFLVTKIVLSARPPKA